MAKTKLTYTKVGDYYIPNLILPPEDDRPIGNFGRRHKDFLQQHKKFLQEFKNLTDMTLYKVCYKSDF